MFNSGYFMIILIFSCLICLFFLIFNLYYNERYFNSICGSNMCVILSILLLLLYRMYNENWVLKGITAVVFSIGMLLAMSASIIAMKVRLRRIHWIVIFSFLVVDFFCFPFYMDVSVFLHKVVIVFGTFIISFKFFLYKKKNLLSRILLFNNIIAVLIQGIFAFLWYFNYPVHFFWDNMAYVIQNFITSMTFVCITIQDSKKYYNQKVDELQDEIALSQQQLKESYEKNQLRNDFFAELSHELKTPVNVINSNIQLFEKCLLVQDSKEGLLDSHQYLKSMQENCYRLVKLVNNIIDMNKIEAGYMVVDAKNYNVIPFIEDMVMSIEAYALQKQISIIFDTEIEELIIACDMDKVEKIVFNLLSNAIKYTPNGGEVLTYISWDEGYMYVTIQDTGEGIPESLHEIIFDRFTQNIGDLHEKHNSSGLGLALVKSLVELQGGKIWIEKEYKEGCKITFSLPIVILDDMEPILYKAIGYSEYNLEFI